MFGCAKLMSEAKIKSITAASFFQTGQYKMGFTAACTFQERYAITGISIFYIFSEICCHIYIKGQISIRFITPAPPSPTTVQRSEFTRL